MTRVRGQVFVPGDKSITHRALLVAGLASGTSRIHGALTSLDARSTARLLRAAGIAVSRLIPGSVVTVQGSARWREPPRPVDCGNSGTTARLGLGILAAQPGSATLTGDRSLRRRPMRRVTEPLERMGAHFEPPGADRLPITVSGTELRPLCWDLPVSSAQLKSAVLLAGLAARVDVGVREPHGASRDHTERMLRWLGQRVDERDGWIELRSPEPIRPFELRVPGDPSSAAFLAGAALLASQGELLIRGVGVNPTRTGFLRVIERMGGGITTLETSQQGGEPMADLLVRPAPLTGTTVRAAEVPGLIDEVPLLAVLAARADGETTFEQVGELRVKESDRLGLLAANLRGLGYEADADASTLRVRGSTRPPRGPVQTDGDHRLAMAFAVLGTVPGADVVIDDPACVAVSFPGFFERLRSVLT